MENGVSELTLKLKDYKAVCAKLGIVMCAFYICRVLAGVAVYFIIDQIGVDTGSVLQYALSSAAMVLFVYVIPIAVSAALFKSFDYYAGKLQQLYSKPKRLAKNIGNFPAMYGLGQSVNLLTILVFFLISLIASSQGEGIELERFFDQMAADTPQSVVSALIMVFVMVFVAPIAEEFWVRGIIYDALKPFGYGTAIVISAILFVLMHGSLEMLFYTTALGLALGYVRYATDSLLVVTILHMIFNAIAAVMMFLLSVTFITGGEHGIISTVSNIYIFAMLVLVVIGLAAFFKKIPRIRRYKIANNWGEVGARVKLALFFASIPVIIMLVLAFDALANHLLLEKVIEIVVGIL